jgi:hypothetical protein
MKNDQVDICSICVHDEPNFCSVIGTIPHCCKLHWHCKPASKAYDYQPKEAVNDIKRP